MLFLPLCPSDSGLYQTEQQKCSWDLTRVNTPPSPWPWQLAKTGMRPNLVGPSAQWPRWKQSPDIEQREPEKNVLSYKEQSLGWFIVLILVIYHWMRSFIRGCQQLCRNSNLDARPVHIIPYLLPPGSQTFRSFLGMLPLAALLVYSQIVWGPWVTLLASLDLSFLNLKSQKLKELFSKIPSGQKILWQDRFRKPF